MEDTPNVTAGRRLRWAAAVVVIAACTVSAVRLFQAMGPVGLLLIAPAWGGLVAYTLIWGLGVAARLERHLRWRRVAGRYYEHRGRRIDIVEDAAGHRFARLAHVRQVLPGLPSDASFEQRFAGRTLRHGRHLHLRDDALVDFLAKAQAEPALKLRRWLEDEVLRPGVRKRQADEAGELPHGP